MDLSRSQSFIKQVFEHSPLATIVMDPVTYRYIDCNQAALRLCGVPAKDAFLGKTPMDFSAPSQYDGRRSSEAAAAYIAMAIAEGYARFEWRHQRPDGEKWDAEVHLRPFEADGMPLLQFSLVDITERKALEKTQSLLHGLMMELNSCVDLGSGLKAVLDSALRLECLDSGGIYIASQSDVCLELAVHSGFSLEFAALTGSFPADSPQARRAARGEALYGEYESLLPASDPIRKHEGLRAFAMIPIMAGGALVAVMNLASHAHATMPEYVKRALELIAYQAGGTLLRLRADAALRESDEVLRRFLANSPIFAFIKSVSPTESRFLLASDTFKDFLGLSGREIAGTSTAELFPKELADKTVADEWETVSTGKVRKSEDSYRGRQYSVITFPIVQEHRALLAGYIMDITDRKRAEEELRNEKRFVEKLLDGLPVLFYLFDKDMRLKRWNRRLQEFSGFSEDMLSGRVPLEDTPNIASVEFLKTILEAPPGEPGAQHMELELTDSRGNIIPCLLSGTRLETDEGPMVMGVAQDISDLKRAEAENEDLIQRLNQVQKLESLGIFAGGIAHDFNNLLGGIFGYLDMANAEKSEEKRRAYLSKALGSIDRARSLTQQLLTFAKGGAPVKKVASLMPFLRETVLFALSGSSVSSAFDVQQGLWPCDFDANQIGQVLDNIVINAVQAMPFGGKIEIRAANASLTEGEHPMLAPGDYVRISIRDTGIGIPKEYLNRIFDPFYTTKPKGHGLGLSTSFSIIHRHNGCIDVESEPGAGSVFHVYLPASAEAAVKACETPASAHSGQGLFLVMDDEPVLRDIIGAMLDSFGYSVIFAENGQEAITLFQDCAGKGQKLSGMIFDLTIPGGMGGKEAIVEIRKLDSALPVFVASGYGDDPVMANPGAYGFTSSLRKPFRRKEIAELLNLGSANGGENPGS